MEQHENKFFELYGKIIAQDGVTPIPMALFRHQMELGLDCSELVFVCYVMTYRWTAGGDPYPSIKKMAVATGISEKTLHSYKNKLIKKEYLRLINRCDPQKGKLSNGYDFTPLLETLEKIILSKNGEDPVRASVITDGDRRENGNMEGLRNKEGKNAFDNKNGGVLGGSFESELSTLSTISTEILPTHPTVKTTVPPSVKSTVPPTVKTTDGVKQGFPGHPTVKITDAPPLSNLQMHLTPSTDELNNKDLIIQSIIHPFNHSNNDDVRAHNEKSDNEKSEEEGSDVITWIREALQYAGFSGTPMEIDYLKGHPLLLIREALKKAVLGGVKRLDYVIGTLNSWAEKGIATLEEVEKESRSERYRRSSPWPSPSRQKPPQGSKPHTYERRYTT